eukprot:2601565-Rhodomonas_salina.2
MPCARRRCRRRAGPAGRGHTRSQYRTPRMPIRHGSTALSEVSTVQPRAYTLRQYRTFRGQYCAAESLYAASVPHIPSHVRAPRNQTQNCTFLVQIAWRIR